MDRVAGIVKRALLHGIAGTLLLALFAACGEDKVQKVEPVIRVVATHEGPQGERLLDYGPVPVLNRKELSLLVSNDGLAALTVHALTFGGEAEAFHVEGLPAEGLRLEAGAEQEIAITFQPPAEAEFADTITLEHNDERNGPVEVQLTGVGSTVGRIEVRPRAVDFGRVGERTQVVKTVRIRSVGSAPLIIESVELEGDEAFSLLGSASTPVSLPAPEGSAPGGAVDLLIACSPTEGTEADVLEGRLKIRSTDPESREVEVELAGTVNRAPVAVIGETGGVPAPGDPVALDGSESHDVDGDEPIEFLWRVYRKPLGSEAYIDEPASPTPQLVTDLPGTYVVGLDVADAQGLSCLHPDDNPAVPCETRTLDVKPADELYFELVWDHPDTDLDLHLLENGAPLGSARDCYYGNPNPDFGEPLDESDDPALTRDDLRGYGPERIVFTTPPEGRFDVVVIFAKGNGAPEPATAATLRVFVYGVLEAEMTTTLEFRDQRWDVLSVDWPSAQITPIDLVDGEEQSQ